MNAFLLQLSPTASLCYTNIAGAGAQPGYDRVSHIFPFINSCQACCANNLQHVACSHLWTRGQFAVATGRTQYFHKNNCMKQGRFICSLLVSHSFRAGTLSTRTPISQTIRLTDVIIRMQRKAARKMSLVLNYQGWNLSSTVTFCAMNFESPDSNFVVLKAPFLLSKHGDLM